MSARNRADRFWEEFGKREHDLKEAFLNQQEERAMALTEELDSLAYEWFGSHIFVDFSYGDFELTWDTGPNKSIQYLAAMVCQRAPADVQKNWILNACLPPLSQKAIQAAVQIKDHIYALPDFLVFYTEQEQTWACKLYCPGYSLIKNPENKREMSMYLLEIALGECAYESYISSVDFMDEPDPDQPFCSLVDAYEVLMDTVSKKGWKEYASPLEIYSVYQPIEDFAHDSLGKDKKMIFTTVPLLVEESLEGQTDVIKDLEAKEGRYIYMYYVNLFNNREDALYRQQLSRKLNEELSKEQIGNVIGGAIGKSYSYIDWIVYDEKAFEKAFIQIQKKLDPQVKLYYNRY